MIKRMTPTDTTCLLVSFMICLSLVVIGLESTVLEARRSVKIVSSSIWGTHQPVDIMMIVVVAAVCISLCCEV